METTENEIWLDLTGYEGIYKVSNIGRVASINKGIIKIMKQRIKGGYKCIGLTKDGIQKQLRVHRLIAMMFCENKMDYPCVNHKDGNKSNNHYLNLEWCNQKQNIRHAAIWGLLKNWETNRGVLSTTQVAQIKFLFRLGFVPTEIAPKFGVDTSVIYNIYANRCYK